LSAALQRKNSIPIRRLVFCRRLFMVKPGSRLMEPTDAELMARWQRGDALAFEALVRRWQRPVAGLLGRLAGTTQVPDLCQEAFLRLFHAGPRYRESGAFRTWLYRIVLNVARDCGRRQRREALRLHRVPTSLETEVAMNGAGPADATCQKEVVQLLSQALAELPAPLREVLVFRHYEGLKFEQIARLTGTPASTLKSRFSVALERLRERLQSLGWGPEETSP
jgi:RNA polymerase sigma-70 factor (ECF subfamily)